MLPEGFPRPRTVLRGLQQWVKFCGQEPWGKVRQWGSSAWTQPSLGEGGYLEVTVAHIYTELQRDAGDRCRYSFFKMEVICMGDTLLAGKYRIRFLFRS